MGLALFTFQNHVFNPTFVVGAFVSFGVRFVKQEEKGRAASFLACVFHSNVIFFPLSLAYF